MVTNFFLASIAEDICKHQDTQTVPYTYYYGLSSSTPQLDGTGVTEPTADTGYTRVAVSNDENYFSDSDDNGGVKNHTAIYFPESIKPWNGLTHYVVFDAPEGGNLLMYGEFDETMNVPIKTIISIPINEWCIKASNPS